MDKTVSRTEMIAQRLRAAFAPCSLEVIDDSARHIGHPGAASGAGHYTVVIAARQFAGLSRLQIHRAIHAVLTDLMPEAIHALCIKIKHIPPAAVSCVA